MATGLMQAETPFLPPPDLAAARAVMVSSLVRRGFPLQDAEDVVQGVLVRIAKDPSAYADKLADVEQHRRWFTTVAMNAYLMMLRGEQRRRRRETEHSIAVADSGDGLRRHVPGPQEIMTIADAAGLTAHQRAYLQAVVVDHLGVEDIARVHGTSTRAVRAVLQRAALRMARHLRKIHVSAG